MTYKELYEKIRDVAFTARKNIQNGIMVTRQVETVKNVMYNNLGDIEAALKFAAEAEEKMMLLETELDDAEKELDEKDDEIKRLKAGSSAKKSKTAAVADEG